MVFFFRVKNGLICNTCTYILTKYPSEHGLKNEDYNHSFCHYKIKQNDRINTTTHNGTTSLSTHCEKAC